MPCLLLPPPFREKPVDGRQRIYKESDLWEVVYIRTHNQYLSLNPEDDDPLRDRLNAWKKLWRKKYEEEKKYRNESTLEKLHLNNLAEKKYQLKLLEIHYNDPHRIVAGVEVGGLLNVTLEMVKQGRVEGIQGKAIRDDYLEEQWAKETGIDLEEMTRERYALFSWIKKHVGVWAFVKDVKLRENRRELIPPPEFGSVNMTNV